MGNSLERKNGNPPRDQSPDACFMQIRETRIQTTTEYFHLVTNHINNANHDTPEYENITLTRWQKIRTQLRKLSGFFKTQPKGAATMSSSNSESSDISKSVSYGDNIGAYETSKQSGKAEAERASCGVNCSEDPSKEPYVQISEEETLEWIFAVQAPITPNETEMYKELQAISREINNRSMNNQNGKSKTMLCTECRVQLNKKGVGFEKNETNGTDKNPPTVSCNFLNRNDARLLRYDKDCDTLIIDASNKSTCRDTIKCITCDKELTSLDTQVEGRPNRAPNYQVTPEGNDLQSLDEQSIQDANVADNSDDTTVGANRKLRKQTSIDLSETKPKRPKLKVSFSLDFSSRDQLALETINENLILHTPPLDTFYADAIQYQNFSSAPSETSNTDNEIRQILTDIEVYSTQTSLEDRSLDISKTTSSLEYPLSESKNMAMSMSENDLTKATKLSEKAIRKNSPSDSCASIDSSKRFRLMRLFGKTRSPEQDSLLSAAKSKSAKAKTKPYENQDSASNKENVASKEGKISSQQSPKLENAKHSKWRRNTAASLADALTPRQNRRKHESNSENNSPKGPRQSRSEQRRLSKVEGNAGQGGGESALKVVRRRMSLGGARSLSYDGGGGSRSRRHSVDGSDGSLAMFGRKNHGDVKKSAIKVLDPKKDNLTRLKHLRVVLDAYDNQEAKAFFDQNYSHIYFVFYEAFTGVENDLKQRATKSHREELDYVIFIFEKILTLLPELIHKRWQYHSIGRIMKKLLHSGNSIKLRREGMRLFLVWYQILMDNALDECHQIYASLVPKLGLAANTDVDIFTRSASEGMVAAMEITPVLLPQSGDKQPENLTKWLLEALLTFTVSEVKKIEWTNKENHEYSFTFLFNKFKEYYLLKIFPHFNKDSSIYEPSLELPGSWVEDSVPADAPARPFEVSLCQDVLVKWLALYTHAAKRDEAENTVQSASRPERSEDEELMMNGEQIDPPTDRHMPGSNASTLSNASGYTENEFTESSISSEDQPATEQSIVSQVLYANRENVNMVHEVFRQAFLFPFSHSGAMRKVIAVYKDWFHEDSRDHRPPFFLDREESMSEDSPDGGSPPPSSQQHVRAAEEVKAGAQAVMQVFITNSANVFLLEQPVRPEQLEGQVDMCKRVLNIYRYMVMNISMNQNTWEQLLKVLLKIVSGVLSTTPPKRKENTLGGKLAQPLFQTLIVTWIKANLNVLISAELWDEFLQVLSSLTGWVELVREWAKTMETLTRVLARQVYGLDLNDLPLNRLSEQKEKRRRGARPMQGSARKARDRTFSRGWSRHEMVENLRAQLLRTNEPVGVPGSGATIQRQALAVNIPVNRHNIHSVSVSKAVAKMGMMGLPLTPSTDMTDDISVFRSHSTVGGGRQRSRSGQSSPVRGTKLSDPGPEPTNLVRSNSDTSLMVNFEGKGSNEILFDDDDRASLNDEALVLPEHDDEGMIALPFSRSRIVSASSTYYSASEDMDEEDVLFAASRAAHKQAALDAHSQDDENQSQGSAHGTHGSPRDDSRSKTNTSSARPFISRKVSTISTVSLGDTSFNLEEATNIPTSKSVPDFKSQDSSDSPRDIRKLRARFSKESSFDEDIFEEVDYTSSQRPELDDIHEVPKPLETDLDNLSTSSGNTMTSEHSSSSQVPTIVLTRSSDTPVPPEVLVQKWNSSRSSSRESTPKMDKKLVKKDAEDGSRKTYNLSEKQKSMQTIKHEKYTKIDDTVKEISVGKAPKATLDEDIDTASEASSTDENRNRLLQINVNEKGNVTKILLHGDLVTESSTDPQKIPTAEKATKGTLLARSLERKDNEKNKKGSQVLRGEEIDQSYASSTVADDASLASVDSSPIVPYQEVSTDSSVNCDRSSMGERSDNEVLLRISESGSEARRSMSSGSPDPSLTGHRGHIRDSSSPITRSADAMGVIEERETREAGRRFKDSPTPDRESLHIEETGGNTISNKSSHIGSKSENSRHHLGHEEEEEDLQSVDLRSILAGGNLCGWTPDVAVVMWRRLLGVLGDVNQIQDPIIHEQVFDHLKELIDTINKLRDNLGVSVDNQNSPAPPELLPPVWLFTPWLLEALSLGEEYRQGKLLAGQLLCSCVLRRHDLLMDDALLARFYSVLHAGLVHSSQDMVNVLVRHCNARFFSLPLSGSSMMILDFIHAANTIASSTELKDAPRAEAMCILGALLCFPNHFGPLPVLQPDSQELSITTCADIKDHLISILLKSGKKEPTGLARCISISCLGIFLYEEIVHNPEHPMIAETVKVLLSTLRFSNKAVAQVATDMLQLLCDHVHILLKTQPDLCERIVDSTCTAIHCLLSATERSNSLDDKRLLVSIMFCLLEWTMRLPMDMLLQTSGGHKSLLYKIFRVLNLSVMGTHGTLTPRDSQTDIFTLPQHEDDLELVREGPSQPTTPHEPPPGFGGRPSRTRDSHSSIIKMAARTVMSHVVKHLCHFPMGGGAARMNSSVHECHDLAACAAEELNPQLFDAPTVQFFVVNNTTLMSFVEIPAMKNLPGGGVTAGLTTGQTMTRLVLRDVGGRYAWDSSVLYGPPMCRAGSFPADPVSCLEIVEDIDQVGRQQGEALELPERDPEQLPLYSTLTSAKDSLDELLAYIGHTSPECQLYPGESLNVPFHAPVEISESAERRTKGSLMTEKLREADHASTHSDDAELRARAMKPVESCETSTAFHLCRLFLNQLGYLAWGKRPHFDLLKKSDALIRELKHLDNLMCRETHKMAVIYVARGQEDKTSVLNNSAGSQAYEHFVSGLGWEVDLEHHPGFLGGLSTNKSTGVSAPYYATSTQEVIFHVSTRMPAETEEHKVKKLRHLGNDWVQIVWSEHTRDYRRGIIPTEFGDVLIVIYPLNNGLYRIHIDRKPEVPFFGPLFSGALVPQSVLVGLVRATAINASRLLRTLQPGYRAFYEERAKCVETIVQQHRESSTFEHFAAHVFAPVLPQGGDLIGSHLPEPMLLPNGHPLRTDAEQTDRLMTTSDKTDKHSPQPAAKTKDNEGISSVFNRRLSFGKSKKSVTKQLQQQRENATPTPPGSPNSNYRA